MKYKKMAMDIFDKANLEAANAAASALAEAHEKLTAGIDYLAMMTDVELPDGEEGAAYEQEI